MHGRRFVVSADVLRTELRVGMYDSHPTPENRVAFPRCILDSGQALPLDYAKTSSKKKRKKRTKKSSRCRQCGRPWKNPEYTKNHKIPEDKQGTGFKVNLNFNKNPDEFRTVAREHDADGFPCLPPCRMPQDR
jgi:hypothetical protein